MDNLSWGNPVAHRVRVHFNTVSTVIYEGMPVCYNYDTTVNWAGGSVSDGAVTASTTLTAGIPETAAAKYLEVEIPSTTNLQWFAGVVAKGGWCGKTTSATAGVGQILDIYVPNGAIVPVRAGIDCTQGTTILSVIAATQYLGQPLWASWARPVAISEETKDRTTAGLVLAKLDPNLFVYQTLNNTALLIGAGVTTELALVLNSTKVRSTQTDGSFVIQKVYGEIAGAGGSASWGVSQVRLYVSSASQGTPATGYAGGAFAASVICNTGATLTGYFYAVRAELNNSAATPATVAAAYMYNIVSDINCNTNAPAELAHMRFASDGSADPNYWFVAKDDAAVAMAAGGSLTASHHLKIKIGTVGYNILLDAT